MQKIRLVPAIDIKDGKAIEAVEGRRNQYRELKSNVTNSSDPLELAIAYENLGFTEVYIADLDGILNSRPNYDILKNISLRTKLSAMADIGFWSLEEVLNLERIKPVIATESFTSLNMLELPGDFVLSLDTRNGEFMSALNITLADFVKIIKDSVKIKEILLTDLARFGMPAGPNLELCRYAIKELPGKDIMYAGGIRNMEDIRELYETGIKKAVVGFGLHSGSILRDFYNGLFAERFTGPGP
ncbi:MAG: hypothetical protein JW724_03930 [Candidatus Altiarchaeota archaeon]|nr:hypothetical protein [Candidatus Altiarchaeota archaeon]